MNDTDTLAQEGKAMILTEILTVVAIIAITVMVVFVVDQLLEKRSQEDRWSKDWTNLMNRYWKRCEERDQLQDERDQLEQELLKERDRAESFLFRLKREQERSAELLEDLSKLKKQNESLLSTLKAERLSSYEESGGFPEIPISGQF